MTALAALLAPVPAAAEGGLVDQVERLEIEAGEFETEGQLIYAEENDEETLLLGTTFEYGLTDNFQLGVEFEAEREAGEALILETIGFQFKWAVIDPEDAGIGIGIQSALTLDPASGELGSETFLIAESRLRSVDAAANLVIETEPGDFSEASSAYAVRLDRELSDRFALGIEAGGALSGEGEGSHFVGPVATAALGDSDGAAAELGVFAPLSEEAPGLQIRLEIDLAF